MSNSFGFENSASWGSAGIALGLGIIEGRQREQRHREIVHAIQNSGRDCNMDTEIALIQSKYQVERKDAQIHEMQALLDMYRMLDAERVQEIEKLRAALKSSEAAAKKLVDRQNEIIGHQDKYFEAVDAVINGKNRRLAEKDRAISEMNKTIVRLEEKATMWEGVDYFSVPRVKKSGTPQSNAKSPAPK